MIFILHWLFCNNDYYWCSDSANSGIQHKVPETHVCMVSILPPLSDLHQLHGRNASWCTPYHIRVFCVLAQLVPPSALSPLPGLVLIAFLPFAGYCDGNGNGCTAIWTTCRPMAPPSRADALTLPLAPTLGGAGGGSHAPALSLR